MIPLYIFDLDGTLANLTHRLHHVQRPSLKCYDCGGKNRKACPVCFDLDIGWKANWDAFHTACANDTPIPQTIGLLSTLHEADNEIWIWSGRSDMVREQTVNWIDNHILQAGWMPFRYKLEMRKAGDFTADDTLKESWLHSLFPEDRARLVMTFDDRNRVVAMWRRNGILCAQVAQGDF